MNHRDESAESAASRRERLYVIIFEADTPGGKLFDVVLLIAILLSVLVVLLESVQHITAAYGEELFAAECFFTLLFTVEYVCRLYCARSARRYAVSFFGLVDLLAIVPTYLTLAALLLTDNESVLLGVHSLTVIRALRLLRAFRIFKLAHMVSEASTLRRAVWSSRAKISVFLSFVTIVVVIVGAAMYLIEGAASGFTSIPQSMYWTVVTMTTVGYGDVAPQTPVGKMLAGILMVLGYSLIIIPTGIVSTELAQTAHQLRHPRRCHACHAEGHDADAAHCKFCGARL